MLEKAKEQRNRFRFYTWICARTLQIEEEERPTAEKRKQDQNVLPVDICLLLDIRVYSGLFVHVCIYLLIMVFFKK